MVDARMMWPYWPTLVRLALAVAIGLFVGIERERRRKEAGLRTFAFASLLGGVGGLLDDRYALLALALLGVLVILLNLDTIYSGEGAEITTSAALLVTGFAGVLAGKGHTFTPTALGIATVGLLAWKEPLAGFSRALTESEVRSAILFAIIAFVVYPVLPEGYVDPWQLIQPRAAWVTVVLIAGLGFTNYVLLKLYGARGIAVTGFFGGLVNSTVTVTELSQRVRDSGGAFAETAFRGILLATAAMLVRNGVILALLAPATVRHAILPLALMLMPIGVGAWRSEASRASSTADESASTPPGSDVLPALASPFSMTAVLKFGVLFLVLQVAGTLAQRALGSAAFYGVSVVGGMVSSASAVASAANLAATNLLSPRAAAAGALIASLASTVVDLPLVSRVGGHAPLTRRIARVTATAVLLGLAGIVMQSFVRW